MTAATDARVFFDPTLLGPGFKLSIKRNVFIFVEASFETSFYFYFVALKLFVLAVVCGADCVDEFEFPSESFCEASVELTLLAFGSVWAGRSVS